MVLGRKETKPFDQDDFNQHLVWLRYAIMGELGTTDITLHDIQNCMCEYSKYVRISEGGRGKVKYKHEIAF